MIDDQAALLIGTISATMASAGSVVLAFLRPALRFTMARLEGRAPTFSDHLCAGIWSCAFGTLIITAVGIIRLVTGNIVALPAAVAWCFIGGGYFLHFTAWRASFLGETSSFQWRWASALCGVGVAAGFFSWIILGVG